MKIISITLLLSALAFSNVAHATDGEDDTCGDVLSGQVYDCTATFSFGATTHACLTWDVADEHAIDLITVTAEDEFGGTAFIECGCTIDNPEEDFHCIGPDSEDFMFYGELEQNGDFTGPAYALGTGSATFECEQVTTCTP